MDCFLFSCLFNAVIIYYLIPTLYKILLIDVNVLKMLFLSNEVMLLVFIKSNYHNKCRAYYNIISSTMKPEFEGEVTTPTFVVVRKAEYDDHQCSLTHYTLLVTLFRSLAK